MATVVKMGDSGGAGKGSPKGADNRMAMMIGGGILLLVILGVVAVMMMNRPPDQAAGYTGSNAPGMADTGEMPGEFDGGSPGGDAGDVGDGSMQEPGGAPVGGVPQDLGGAPMDGPAPVMDPGSMPPAQMPGN